MNLKKLVVKYSERLYKVMRSIKSHFFRFSFQESFSKELQKYCHFNECPFVADFVVSS